MTPEIFQQENGFELSHPHPTDQLIIMEYRSSKHYKIRGRVIQIFHRQYYLNTLPRLELQQKTND